MVFSLHRIICTVRSSRKKERKRKKNLNLKWKQLNSRWNWRYKVIIFNGKEKYTWKVAAAVIVIAIIINSYLVPVPFPIYIITEAYNWTDERFRIWNRWNWSGSLISWMHIYKMQKALMKHHTTQKNIAHTQAHECRQRRMSACTHLIQNPKVMWCEALQNFWRGLY